MHERSAAGCRAGSTEEAAAHLSRASLAKRRFRIPSTVAAATHR